MAAGLMERFVNKIKGRNTSFNDVEETGSTMAAKQTRLNLRGGEVAKAGMQLLESKGEDVEASLRDVSEKVTVIERQVVTEVRQMMGRYCNKGLIDHLMDLKGAKEVVKIGDHKRKIATEADMAKREFANELDLLKRDYGKTIDGAWAEFNAELKKGQTALCDELKILRSKVGLQQNDLEKVMPEVTTLLGQAAAIWEKAERIDRNLLAVEQRVKYGKERQYIEGLGDKFHGETRRIRDYLKDLRAAISSTVQEVTRILRRDRRSITREDRRFEKKVDHIIDDLKSNGLGSFRNTSKVFDDAADALISLAQGFKKSVNDDFSGLESVFAARLDNMRGKLKSNATNISQYEAGLQVLLKKEIEQLEALGQDYSKMYEQIVERIKRVVGTYGSKAVDSGRDHLAGLR